MLTRNRVLLHLLASRGGRATRLQVVKWSFLLAQETESRGGPAFYQFVPYRHGPFSFGLYREMQSLVDVNLVECRGGVEWQLTDLGRAASTLPAVLKSDVDVILDTYGHLRDSQLVDNVHSRYPWFAVNSEAGDVTLRSNAESLVYTAGYQGLLVDGFLNGLLRHGIECIIDVRRNPISRNYGYHGATLARLAGHLGIEYRHFPSLGIDGRERRQLVDQADYDHLFAAYREATLANQTETIIEVGDLMRRGPSALLCFEKCPAQCHRFHLAESIARLINRPIRHLDLQQ